MRLFKRIFLLVCFLAGGVTELLLIYIVGMHNGLMGLLGTILLTGWCLLPYALLVHMTYRQVEMGNLSILIIFGTVIIGWGIFKYIDGFFVHSDAQSGLLLFVIPFFQLIGCLLLKIILWISTSKRGEDVSLKG